MENFEHLMQYVLNIDSYLLTFVTLYGVWAYVALFLIIFCETGLIITPFLPGDSLLFAAGSIAASPNQPLSMQLLLVILILASIAGNKVNYLIGRKIGPKVFTSQKTWLFNPKHIQEAHQFYEKHGGKTIIIARFLPIIRTFAPFIAGVGYMSLQRFTVYNILSGILWISSILYAGYFLGKLPFVQENFSIVIYGVIAFTLIPPTLAFVYRKAFKNKA